MSVVVGTAGHIDHGKTTLLRALTGIDADRLPEERRRGMTIDVGYAHLALADGDVLDFVDVPGHDRLVGNMLVGAGEIDAVLLVVAADDGPNAQTLEHVELLDALGISDGVVAVTRTDLVTPSRSADVAGAVADLLRRTRLAGLPIVEVSAVTGRNLEELRAALEALRDRVVAREGDALSSAGDGRIVPSRLAIDRVFAVRGRGTVVTGTLRGAPVTAGTVLRLLPAGLEARVREVQVRGEVVPAASGGRTALLLGGVDAEALHRGQVLTADPWVVATSRVLAGLRGAAPLRPGGSAEPLADRARLRLHLGTEQVDALVVRGPREDVELPDGSRAAILRLARPIAAAPGDRCALRWPSPPSTAGGGVILDPAPPRGVSRRRVTPARVSALAGALNTARPDRAAVAAAMTDLHGLARVDGPVLALAADVSELLFGRARALVAAHHASEPGSPGIAAAALRAALAAELRRWVTVNPELAERVARSVIDEALAGGTLARTGDRFHDPGRPTGLPPATLAAMDRLEASLTGAAPPPLAEAARAAGCPPEGIRALEADGRVVRVEDDLAWASTTYRELTARALEMAAAGPLSPAAFRDATGTSRRFVLAILEDLGRRGLLRRTDAGHVRGSKA